jgi:hypothetical protein
LHQFGSADNRQFSVDTRHANFQSDTVAGSTVLSLHAFGTESVALVRWQPGVRRERTGLPGGEEILVLEGLFEDEHGVYPAGTWVRNPPDWKGAAFSTDGCFMHRKTGHLPAEKQIGSSARQGRSQPQ